MSTLCLAPEMRAWSLALSHTATHASQSGRGRGSEVMWGECPVVARRVVDAAADMSRRAAASLPRAHHAHRAHAASPTTATATRAVSREVIPDYFYVPRNGGASIYDAGAPSAAPAVVVPSATSCTAAARMQRRRAAGANVYDAGAGSMPNHPAATRRRRGSSQYDAGAPSTAAAASTAGADAAAAAAAHAAQLARRAAGASLFDMG